MCGPVLGWSQVTVGPETMTEALDHMRTSGGLALVLQGEDQTANRTFTFRVNTYFVPATETKPPKIEVWSYRNDKLDRLLVGDGENFTRFDPALNQYSMSAYNSLDGLMKMLQTTGGGNIGVPVRVIQDMTKALPWSPWLRNYTLDTRAPLTFKISEGDPIRTQYAFRFAEPLVPEVPILKEVSGFEARSGLTTTWLMKVFPGFDPVDVKFKFVAPAGAHPVSAPGSVRTPN